MSVATDGAITETSQLRSPRRNHFARAALIGVCAGLVAVAFRQALAFAETNRYAFLQRLHEHPGWGWIVLPSIGLALGCLVGWIVTRFAPETAGSGIPHLKGVLLHLRTLSWLRVIPIKFFGGVAAIGSGLSLGREGPTVQMGGGHCTGLCRSSSYSGPRCSPTSIGRCRRGSGGGVSTLPWRDWYSSLKSCTVSSPLVLPPGP